MRVNNILKEESLGYDITGIGLTERIHDIKALDEVSDFCKKQGEKIEYSIAMYEMQVEPNLTMMDLLYSERMATSADAIALLIELIDKKWKLQAQEEPQGEIIRCSLGKSNNAAHNMTEYMAERQQLLRTLTKQEEYLEFMKSCFSNSVFAEGFDEEFMHIKDFKQHMDEITDCLQVLDSEAITLYEEYKNNLQQAMNILTKKLCTCGPDPKHEKDLHFIFQYEVEENGEVDIRKKDIICSPHLKLIRDDSDLRIYFYWKDADICEGKKVLIGRVGRHTWSKYKK